MRPFRVVTRKNWLADLFKPFGAVQDFGFDIDPDTAPETYWWAPGAWVASASKTGVDLPLLSCGPYWLDRLPWCYTGRDIRTAALGDLPKESTRPLFVKLPEAKTDSCPAQIYDTPQLAETWRGFGFPDNTLVQWQSVVEFVTEARFFIADGAVAASSLYRHKDWMWGADDTPHLRSEMRTMDRFVGAVLNDQAVAYPPGFVLDVGITQSGEARVVEANAAWSSGPYDADPAGVVAAIKASHDHRDVHRKWRWRDHADSVWAKAVPLKTSKTAH
ncbi:hypothetical protein BKG82_26840 [Mycobacteroides chelonae]|uniref:ATP-grasp domain-containing protein n=1 Tax=Mycobacteroides chelonae TaxID=1774 RepID=A0A1S1LIX8_MYCCH|nr:ATP-grasp domain-containing protein [Mycobacteroides chelonae]OHU47272.1 hypothetical protein BKG82_26840 [Mycobacteroides chelonae]